MLVDKQIVEQDRAIPIELPVWQAPNDDVCIKHKGDELDIFFKIWLDAGRYSKFDGVLTFKKVWGVRFERHKRLQYYPNREDDDFNSCYWIINDSSWLKKLIMERESYFSDWRDYDRSEYKHYIIQSNQYYIEIIAGKMRFSKKKKII
jgi:hypothetical protein